MKEEHSHNVMAAFVHSPKMHQGIDTSRKGAVQPSSSLPDELWSTFRDVRLSFGCFHVSQMPFGSSLGHELKAQNSILGQEHILLEDVHVLNALALVELSRRMVSMKVLLQRPAHDRTETIRRERTRQDANVTKGAFQRLVQDITDLVFEILTCYERIQEISPSAAQHGVDLAASSTKILVIVKCLPKSQK